MPPFERSWPELKTPTYRARKTLSSPDNWLLDKQIDDCTEGLWRVHDRLYDLDAFVDEHPGGAQWLEITKGTDCTESFESHHLSDKAETMLSKYFVRLATTPRNSPFTFHENGFYKTLKKKVYKELKSLPVKSIKQHTKFIMDSLILTILSLTVLAATWDSYKTAALAGVFLAFSATCCHNFFHKKDNWRMHYFSLTLMSFRDWRISHVLSHHAFTNTLLDLEVMGNEPFFNYLPDPEKCWIVRFVSWIYLPFVYPIMFQYQVFQRIIHSKFRKADMIGFTIPALIFVANGGHTFSAIFMWIWLILVNSFVFNVSDIAASHRSPKIFIEGDAPRRDHDWGLAQIDTTRDSQEFTGILPLVLIAFGEHTLHHLFPTLDHSLLKYLYPTFHETCKDFGVDYKMKGTFDLFIGQFQQLARNKPNKKPPQ